MPTKQIANTSATGANLTTIPPTAPRAHGLAGRRQTAQIQHVEAQAKLKETLKNINPLECPNRIVIVFDNSGSMSGTPLQQAKLAVSGFLDSCNPLDTSIAIATLSAETIVHPLDVHYDKIKEKINTFKAEDSTPLFETLENILKHSIPTRPTRVIVFSDGVPDNKHFKICSLYVDHTPPITIDTVYIGRSCNDSGYDVLKQIANLTNGQCLCFDNISVFTRNLKYLAPTYYGLLASPEARKAIESGDVL